MSFDNDHDRTVHARIYTLGQEPIEVVRYDRAGKWYREQGPHRERLTLLDAVQLATEPIDTDTTTRTVRLNGYGGGRFARQVKLTNAILSAGIKPEWMV